MFSLEQTQQIRNIVLDYGQAKQLIDIIYPVGSFYVQYPSAESNDLSVAFPSSKSPAVLFGGTWVKRFDDEGICFYTEPKTGDTEQTRTNGLQEDQLEDHYHNLNFNGGAGSGGINASGMTSAAPSTDTPAVHEAISIPGGYTIRKGSTTKGRNRLIRVWERV